MGCGKSKPLDVASANTVLKSKSKSKKSSVDDSKVGLKNGTETVQTKTVDNNNVDNEISKPEQKSNENVKKVVDEPNVLVVPNEITNVKQENALENKNQEGDVAQNKTQEIVVADEKNDSLKNKNQPEPAEEAKIVTENEKGENDVVDFFCGIFINFK
jgi:hypothetical protein